MIGGIKVQPWHQCNKVSPVVTATQTGSGIHNGMVLTVKVVTGADVTQVGPGSYSYMFMPGTTGSGSAYTPAEVTITPAGTGSWVYGAANRTDTATAWTADGQSTFSQNVADSANSATYGTFRSTGTTTTGTPITTGATNGDGTSGGGVAVLEVLAAGTLAEDASSPAPVSATSATSVSTARFTPPMGALLVAQVATAGTNVSIAITDDNGDLAWVEQVRWGGFSAPVNSGPNYGGSASGLSGGTGTWASQSNATGAPDGSCAVWTVV